MTRRKRAPLTLIVEALLGALAILALIAAPALGRGAHKATTIATRPNISAAASRPVKAADDRVATLRAGGYVGRLADSALDDANDVDEAAEEAEDETVDEQDSDASEAEDADDQGADEQGEDNDDQGADEQGDSDAQDSEEDAASDHDGDSGGDEDGGDAEDSGDSGD
jgi:hypothetical protein